MDIGCFLVSNGEFVKALIPQELLVELAKNLRTNGKDVVHFVGKTIEVEGIYVPAKGSKTTLMALPMGED